MHQACVIQLALDEDTPKHQQRNINIWKLPDTQSLTSMSFHRVKHPV